MVDRDQIDALRAELNGDPPSFARDLAHALLLEFERLEDAEVTSRRTFAAWQASIIEAQLATTEPTCIICRDAALHQAAEHLRIAGNQRQATRIRARTGDSWRPR